MTIRKVSGISTENRFILEKGRESYISKGRISHLTLKREEKARR